MKNKDYPHTKNLSTFHGLHYSDIIEDIKEELDELGDFRMESDSDETLEYARGIVFDWIENAIKRNPDLKKNIKENNVLVANSNFHGDIGSRIKIVDTTLFRYLKDGKGFIKI